MAQTATNDLDMDRLDAQWEHANALTAAGEAGSALPIYQQIAQACPDVAQIQVNLGIALYMLDRFDEALACFDTAIDIEPFQLPAYLHAASTAEQLDRHAEAVAYWTSATHIEPGALAAQIGLSEHHLANGALDQAQAAIDQAFKIAPDDAEVCCIRGKILAAMDGSAAAVAFLREAHDRNPDPRIAIDLASALSEQGSLAEAVAITRRIIDQAPDSAGVWNGCAAVLMAAKDSEQALACLQRADALAPDVPEIKQNMARCLAHAGQIMQALEIQRALIARWPDFDAVYQDAATLCFQLGRYDEAERLLRRAIELTPTPARLWGELANVLRVARRNEDARRAALRALELDPGNALAELTLAYVLANLGQPAQAYRHSTQALEKAGDDARLIIAVGELYEAWKMNAPASAAYRRALAINPAQPRVSARLFDLALSACDWSDYDALVAEQVQTIEHEVARDADEFDVDVFNMQALPVSYAFTARAAHAAATAIARTARRGNGDAPFVHTTRRRDKIQLGYALGYTFFHSLPMVLKDIVARHDRDRFEVYGYSARPCIGDGFNRAYRATFDQFRDLALAAPRESAAMIHGDAIDVLIDVTGLTSINCMSISSFRPAPVQIHAYGYSITTGADYIDYLITDRTYIPPEWEALGTEKLIYLPNTFMPTCRHEPSSRTVTRAEVGLPDDAVVFCNFNHPCKFEPTSFSAWMRILEAVPGSVMWFGNWLQDTRANLCREAQNRGIDPDRLTFAAIAAHGDHLARLPLADIALDCLQHGGGVTTVDALSVGLPVLTVAGNKPGARLGATLVGAMDMAELVQPDLAGYERRAIDLAQRPDEREALRRKILERRDTSALFDNDGYQRHLEAALTAAWQNHRDGHAPRRIEIRPDGGVDFG